MTTKKLISRMRDFLDLGRRKQRAEVAKIKPLLKKLRRRRRELRDALAKEEDPARRKRMKRDLRVLHEQRKKGLKLLKALHVKSK